MGSNFTCNPVNDVFFLQAAGGLQFRNNPGTWQFPRLHIRYPNHANISNVRMTQDQRLQLGWRHLNT